MSSFVAGLGLIKTNYSRTLVKYVDPLVLIGMHTTS